MHRISPVPLATTPTASTDAVFVPQHHYAPAVVHSESLTIGDLTIDPVWHEVRRDGELVQLTPLEFVLLHILALNANHIVPYDMLVAEAWGYPLVGRATDLIKTPISRVRVKAGLRPPSPLTISSVSRVGYILKVPT